MYKKIVEGVKCISMSEKVSANYKKIFLGVKCVLSYEKISTCSCRDVILMFN